MAVTRMNAKLSAVKRIGGCIGKIASFILKSESAREAFSLSIRRVLSPVSSSGQVPALLNDSALTLWLQRLDGRTVDEVASAAALARGAWLADVAKTIPPAALLLDAGAGEGQYRHLFSHTQYQSQDFAQYTGTDKGPLQEQWNYGNIDYVCDITAIPVEDGKFDAVLCTEVLEHLPEPIAAIQELSRVLRPGGQLILSAPLGCGLHQEPHHYYGGFTPWFYRRFFEQAGIDVVEITPLGGLLQHVAQESHRVGQALKNKFESSSLEFALGEAMERAIPKMVSSLDDAVFIEQFTVGYVVRGVKRDR
ncbi:class I SAM-dependent methyltransferase [Aquipseudomonas alcaligenes]|uniref:class I SAM-dependent methyltransferase n=1 Tax=Aquipseudomonas alcaligenes TaxID=43263 RepID=UPI0037490FD9